VLRSPVADALVQMIRAGAGLDKFRLDSARELMEFSVRRGLINADERDELMAEVKAAARARKGRSKKAARAKKAKPARKVAKKPAARPAAKPAKKPAAKAAKKPATKPAKKPATKQGKKPARKPAKQPGQGRPAPRPLRCREVPRRLVLHPPRPLLHLLDGPPDLAQSVGRPLRNGLDSADLGAPCSHRG
jgi:polyhydroxyalkanoate synthesis regulator phasin